MIHLILRKIPKIALLNPTTKVLISLCRLHNKHRQRRVQEVNLIPQSAPKDVGSAAQQQKHTGPRVFHYNSLLSDNYTT